MIDPEAHPDPGVVLGLEVNKLRFDPLRQVGSWSRLKFYFFFLWGVEEDGEKMCDFAVRHLDDARDARAELMEGTLYG